MFKHITVKDYIMAVTTFLAGKLDTDTDITYDFRECARVVVNVEGRNWWNVLGAKIETKCERVMSDVWEDVTRRHILVWGQRNGNRGLFWAQEGWVNAPFDTENRYYFNEVDSNVPEQTYHEIMEWVENVAGITEAETAGKLAAQKAEDVIRKVEKDSKVTVKRGRKVKVGTVGTVFWMGKNEWGSSVGITVSGVKVGGKYADAQFTSLSNVELNISEEKVEAAKKEAYDAAYASTRNAIVKGFKQDLLTFGVGDNYAVKNLALS